MKGRRPLNSVERNCNPQLESRKAIPGKRRDKSFVFALRPPGIP